MTADSVKRRRREGAHNRRQVVAVIGSGEAADPQCEEVGRLIARLGCDLLTGGGGGAMAAVSRAFFETSPRKGIVIGIVPGAVDPLAALEERNDSAVEYELWPGYPNDWVELVIYTHLPDSGREGTRRSSRNHINVLSADAIVALPGREGTESEAWLATRYGVPIVAYGEHGDVTPAGIPLARSLTEVRAFLARHVGPSARTDR
jgi:predicted Rossmann-fold nucleotide-binding protein